MRITFRNRCPNCHEFNRKRLKRSPWMRFFGYTRLYRCEDCKTIYLLIYLKR